jgi:hypothetical protein
VVVVVEVLGSVDVGTFALDVLALLALVLLF